MYTVGDFFIYFSLLDFIVNIKGGGGKVRAISRAIIREVA